MTTKIILSDCIWSWPKRAQKDKIRTNISLLLYLQPLILCRGAGSWSLSQFALDMKWENPGQAASHRAKGRQRQTTLHTYYSFTPTAIQSYQLTKPACLWTVGGNSEETHVGSCEATQHTELILFFIYLKKCIY